MNDMQRKVLLMLLVTYGFRTDGPNFFNAREMVSTDTRDMERFNLWASDFVRAGYIDTSGGYVTITEEAIKQLGEEK